MRVITFGFSDWLDHPVRKKIKKVTLKEKFKMKK